MKTVLLTSTILIVLTAALRPLLRGRIDPRAQYALWLAAALRLLIPVNFAHSAYSAPALLSRAEEPAHLAQAIGQTAVPVWGMSYEDAFDQALREYHRDKPVQTSFTDLDEVERRARELQARGPTLSELFGRYARPVWLGGAAAAVLWFLLVNLRLRRLLRDALPVETDCPLPVYVSGSLPSPCLFGTVRPAIYVTPAALEGPGRLRHVLAHELTHYRHRDHWWALARCLCLCLYWFDPLVWWAAALSRQDCELACDEGAIRRLGEGERLAYGRTLVDMIAAGRTPLLQTATTMTGGRRQVRERIRLIARGPKTVIGVAVAAALIVGCAVGCTFTGAPVETPSPELSAEGVEPFAPEETAGPLQTVQTVVDRMLTAPGVEYSLAPAGSSRVYIYPVENRPSGPPGLPVNQHLLEMANDFSWEDAPYSTSEGDTFLRVSASDGSASLTLSEGSCLVVDGDGNCWKGVYKYDDVMSSQSMTPFEYLRMIVFDPVELDYLRSTTVPDRGQSHEEIVREWTENWEGAMTKTAPGSDYACTYVRIENIQADYHDFMEEDQLNEWVQSWNLGYSGADYGKTWFTFAYDTVFVPAEQNTGIALWAGNTWYYEGGDAPEGALIYMRVGYMHLTGEGWTCGGVGTGF